MIILNVVCLSWAFVLVTCAPQEPIALVSPNSVLNVDGSYSWSYETANGIKANEDGTLKKAADPTDGNVVVAAGGFSFTGPGGVLYQVTYTADDENGFVPQGAHIPTPPPIPPAIQKALDYIASLPPTPESPRG